MEETRDLLNGPVNAYGPRARGCELIWGKGHAVAAVEDCRCQVPSLHMTCWDL